ncbi:25.3 kDa vesicle transport protein [Papaver somniferum]|uniref:25.3 kDa vesicle transport protein n=1 Tax=Papaver somniferum TaxID=3469 RepID=UPI000E6FC597|nr:25.3 kDa vesicle transport protein [Papaver somniferum]
MVKLTVVGRAYDGLPVAHFPRVKNEEDMSMLFYKQQAEFILKEISRGALLPSKMSINIDDLYCFNYLIEKGICYITLCESSYPRNLAFHYLQDLLKEIEKLDTNFLHTLSKPYSFIKFDNVIANIRRRYLDTRTQANLSILNTNRRQDLDVMTEDISKIIENKRRSEFIEKALAPIPVSPIWSSPRLEVIALKWTPITLMSVVAMVVLWSRFIVKDY